MNPFAYSILADENIHPQIIASLRADGIEIRSVLDVGLGGKADEEILQYAHQTHSAILTHDRDFGRLVWMAQGAGLTGIIYIRPGHIDPYYTLQTLAHLRSQPIDVSTPFVIVAERSGNSVRVRIRQL